MKLIVHIVLYIGCTLFVFILPPCSGYPLYYNSSIDVLAFRSEFLQRLLRRPLHCPYILVLLGCHSASEQCLPNPEGSQPRSLVPIRLNIHLCPRPTLDDARSRRLH